jgi:hypothetical protein
MRWAVKALVKKATGSGKEQDEESENKTPLLLLIIAESYS